MYKLSTKYLFVSTNNTQSNVTSCKKYLWFNNAVNIAVFGSDTVAAECSHKELYISGPSRLDWISVCGNTNRRPTQKPYYSDSSGEMFNAPKRSSNKIFSLLILYIQHQLNLFENVSLKLACDLLYFWCLSFVLLNPVYLVIWAKSWCNQQKQIKHLIITVI